MKRFLSMIVAVLLLTSFTTALVVGCKEKKVDPQQQVEQLFQKGEYRKAKGLLVGLLANFPNDKKLMAMKKKIDKQLSEKLYKQYWNEAKKGNTWKSWVKAMIKIKKVENFNKKMVNEWIDKATEKTIAAAADKEKDAKLLGVLKKLVVRYGVITPTERLAYLTIFHKEGRFPMKEWKGTFLKNFPKLFDENEKFVGYPKPDPKRDKKPKK